MIHFRSIAERASERDMFVWALGLMLLVTLMIALSGCAGMVP